MTKLHLRQRTKTLVAKVSATKVVYTKDTASGTLDAGVQKEREVNQPKVQQRCADEDATGIDYNGYPHIIDAIIGYLDTDMLKTFRLVSRSCCKRVDTLLSTHLVLAGAQFYYRPDWDVKTVLHNGLWGMVGDCRTYKDFTVESDIPFGFSGYKDESTEVTIPEFPRTEVLDIVGTVRGTVLAGLATKLPNLHTIRTYTLCSGDSDHYKKALSATHLYYELDEDPSDFDWDADSDFVGDSDAAPEDSEEPVPCKRIPRIPLVVNFTTMSPVDQTFGRLIPSDLGSVDELIITVLHNPADTVGCEFREKSKSTPPRSLKRATIIFAPSEKTRYSRGCASTVDNFPYSFAKSLRWLRVPTTIVGLEGIGRNPADGMSYDQMVELFTDMASQPLTFVSLAVYRESVSDTTWVVYTRPAPVIPRKLDKLLTEGTNIVGRIGGDLSSYRYPVWEAIPNETDKRSEQLNKSKGKALFARPVRAFRKLMRVCGNLN